MHRITVPNKIYYLQIIGMSSIPDYYFKKDYSES